MLGSADRGSYFESEDEPALDEGRVVSGMTNMASVKGFVVAAAKSEHSSELALYVTDDTDSWHRAEFADHRVEEDAYTILESTNYSIQVDVMSSRTLETGALFTSNSNGTYFTKNIEHTNRDLRGYVDFEKVSNIQGIVLVNVVDNWQDLENNIFAEKQVRSQISFDDGRTFESIKAGDKNLHLHSVTELHNSGRVFSSPAPGLVMGVGNAGKYLQPYSDGNLYVSDDAGLTWWLALEEAHKYEFGDQGAVLVAIFDEGQTDTIKYSLKHGRPHTWNEVQLDSKIRALELTTIPDSTSLRFVLSAIRRIDDGALQNVIISLDFSEMHEDKCRDKDFEKWPARVDEDGEAICIMGQKQFFRRRKWDADCFVDEEFRDPDPEFEACDCDELMDYECDFNFLPSGSGKSKTCEPARGLTAPKGECRSEQDTYMGSSGWRKMPGNACKGKTKKDDAMERPCSEVKGPAASGKITAQTTTFSGKDFREHYYLERSEVSKDKDETVVMLTTEREAWVTHDHGKTWEIAIDDEVVAIYPHMYSNDRVFFITNYNRVYYSIDRALRNSINSFEAPTGPNLQRLQILSFHPKNEDWLVWIGGEDCEFGNEECHSIASVSTKNGRQWEEMLPFVKKCQFIWREEGRQVSEKLVFCEQYAKEEPGANVQLVASEDWFEHKEIKYESVVEFATMSEFIVVASKEDDLKTLRVDASLDGKLFAHAKFPPKFSVDHQQAYTVLDSSTHSIFLHVTVNPRRGQEYGSIIKSNSNGTSYVLSIHGVDRNTAGFVDFEKMQGIEGVAIANVVANREAVDGGAMKQKQSRITHNDGADWTRLTRPSKDADGKKYGCEGQGEEGCSLHLHGYTERSDPRETFSSPTAVGIMMGLGNVGEYLAPMNEASTFLTNNGGITWKEVMKGSYVWEFGDQGSVIVIVRRGEDTDHVYYSLDEGESWRQYRFADKAMRVEAMTTVPSDTSLNFLLWGRDGSQLVTVNLDFSGLFDKKCDLDEKDPTAGDYDLWTPEHPLLEDKQCLFGHVAEYHRKKKGAQCYNGRKIDHLHNIAENCSCTRRDFEWLVPAASAPWAMGTWANGNSDFNFERQVDGSCRKIEGLELADAKAACEQKGVKEYWEVTGYRKIPISTCKGGAEMDHTSQVHACPGYEQEFEEKHGMSGFGLFVAVVVPFAAAAGVGWYVWRHWDGKFGRIRLGDASSARFDGGAAWVRWPVMAVSGVVAVVTAVPLVVGSAWRSVASRFGGYSGPTYTSRSSFARGRGDYAVVDADEGELLGEDSDEDV